MSTPRSAYRDRLTTAESAVAGIKNGETIVYGMSVAQPPALLASVAARARADDLKRIRLYTFLPFRHALETVLDPYLADCIQNLSWFVGGADRNLVKTGLTYHVPTYLHQIPRLCRDFMEIDTVLAVVSPMDRAGYFTFGTANDYISTAARHCRRLIVEVNENMPRIFGDSLLHVTEVDAIVENTVPLIELPPPPARPEDEIIGPKLAELVPDGATIQLGIGGLPNALARYLVNHRDLGVHSELLTTGMIDLLKQGVITGRRKNLHPLKHVFTTAAGTKEMYEFMDDNPSLESYSASYVCNPAVIARN
ncbi:MAG: 4-hydroxybutyrate CoA-transferase, partial [Methanosaeta sp. SDB]